MGKHLLPLSLACRPSVYEEALSSETEISHGQSHSPFNHPPTSHLLHVQRGWSLKNWHQFSLTVRTSVEAASGQVACCSCPTEGTLLHKQITLLQSFCKLSVACWETAQWAPPQTLLNEIILPRISVAIDRLTCCLFIGHFYNA